VLASFGHTAASGATAAVAADGAIYMLAGNPSLTCVARTPGLVPVERESGSRRIAIDSHLLHQLKNIFLYSYIFCLYIPQLAGSCLYSWIIGALLIFLD
jgi:hypothetical protein